MLSASALNAAVSLIESVTNDEKILDADQLTRGCLPASSGTRWIRHDLALVAGGCDGVGGLARFAPRGCCRCEHDAVLSVVADRHDGRDRTPVRVLAHDLLAHVVLAVDRDDLALRALPNHRGGEAAQPLARVEAGVHPRLRGHVLGGAVGALPVG